MSHLIVHALSLMCKYKHHDLLRRKRQEVASWSAAAEVSAHSQCNALRLWNQAILKRDSVKQTVEYGADQVRCTL